MILHPKRRMRRAYWVALKVMLSYRWLKLKSRVVGTGEYQQNLKALHVQNGILIKEEILKLQGLFVKVGQMISTLSNVLPIEFRKPLEELQDRVTPIRFEDIELQILNESGKTKEDLFLEINETPLATASIGQTHYARMKDQTEVVLKIQHPDIDKIAETDLKIIEKLMKFGARRLKMKGIYESYEEIESMIRDELNYQCEAEYMMRFHDRLKGRPVIVPSVIEGLTTTKMMVMTFETGVKINDLEFLTNNGIDKTDLAERLIKLFAEMIFEWGFFHADPHPGNILVNEKGEIILLDFGAIGELTQEMREGMAELLLAFFEFDSDGISKALIKMGFVISDKEAELLSEKIVQLGLDFLKNEVEFEGLSIDKIKLKSGKSAIFKLLKKIDVRNLGDAFQVPKEWILLQRAMALVIGNCNELDPEFNPMDVLKPYLQEYLLGQKSGMKEVVVKFLKRQLGSLIELPFEFNKFLKMANSGKALSDHKKDELLYFISYHSNRAIVFVLLAVVLTLYLLEWTKIESPLLIGFGYLLSMILLALGWLNSRKKNRYIKKANRSL